MKKQRQFSSEGLVEVYLLSFIPAMILSLIVCEYLKIEPDVAFRFAIIYLSPAIIFVIYLMFKGIYNTIFPEVS